jgi:hypothetical protein
MVVGTTVNFSELVACPYEVLTVTSPELLDAVNTAWVFVKEVSVAVVLPIEIDVDPETRFKFEPIRVIGFPGLATVGEKLVMEGFKTVKLCVLVAVAPATVTATGPLIAAAGTVTLRVVLVAALTTAEAPPIVTTS